MSDLSVEQSLEEVDVEKELKQQEAEGEDTGSIVLSESGNESSAEEETEEAETTTPDDDSVTQGSTKESQSETDDNTSSEAAESTSEEAQENLTPTVEEVAAETAESVAQAKLATALGEELSISSDEDTDDEDNETMKKLEQDINKDILYTYHPEIKQINYRELLTLSQVTRNKKASA